MAAWLEWSRMWRALMAGFLLGLFVGCFPLVLSPVLAPSVLGKLVVRALGARSGRVASPNASPTIGSPNTVYVVLCSPSSGFFSIRAFFLPSFGKPRGIWGHLSQLHNSNSALAGETAGFHMRSIQLDLPEDLGGPAVKAPSSSALCASEQSLQKGCAASRSRRPVRAFNSLLSGGRGSGLEFSFGRARARSLMICGAGCFGKDLHVSMANL